MTRFAADLLLALVLCMIGFWGGHSWDGAEDEDEEEWGEEYEEPALPPGEPDWLPEERSWAEITGQVAVVEWEPERPEPEPWARESRELVMPPRWLAYAVEVETRGSAAVVDSLFDKVMAAQVREQLELEEASVREDCPDCGLPAEVHNCPACGRSRWKTLVKGRQWACRICGFVREAELEEA